MHDPHLLAHPSWWYEEAILGWNYHGRLKPPPDWNYDETNVHMRLDHWTSADGNEWVHTKKVFESSGSYDGKDRRASAWSPVVVFDQRTDRWHLFYIGYRASADFESGKHFYDQWDGEAFHAMAETIGEGGLSGAFVDVGVALDQQTEGDFNSSFDAWEGDAGITMFFPYRLDNGTWMALYGSAFGSSPNFCDPTCRQVGLAQYFGGDGLAGGRWMRKHTGALDESFRPASPGVENPVVARTTDGFFVAVYHVFNPGKMGMSYSRDGVRWWRQEDDVDLGTLDRDGMCSEDVTAIAGIIPEPTLGAGVYSVMYTAGPGGTARGGGAVCRAFIVNEGEAVLST